MVLAQPGHGRGPVAFLIDNKLVQERCASVPCARNPQLVHRLPLPGAAEHVQFVLPAVKWRHGARGRSGQGGGYLILVPAGGLPPGPSQTQQSRTPEGEVCRARLKFGRISFVRWDEGDPASQGCPQGHTCK